MKFNLHEVALEYLEGRYPRATEKEREKYYRDWENKLESSKGIAHDFISRVGEIKNKTILDYGFGNGGMSIVFSDLGAKVFGVEVEDDLYEIAKKYGDFLGSNANFVLYDGNKLPFESNFFDAIVSVSVLEHTTDPQKYMDEALRVLKPDGVFYLAFPNRLWPKETHTGLLFVTYLPLFLIRYAVVLFNRNPLEDNNLHFYHYWNLIKFINNNNQDFSWKIIKEDGTSENWIKKTVKSILNKIGISYKAFLPHISVLLRKEARNANSKN